MEERRHQVDQPNTSRRARGLVLIVAAVLRQGVVVSVLFVLFVLVTHSLWRPELGCQDSRPDTARAQVNTIGAVIEAREAKKGSYPTTLFDLTDGDGVKLIPANLRDPWKQPLRYAPTSGGFELCSAGDDREDGTDDDVCYGDEDW